MGFCSCNVDYGREVRNRGCFLVFSYSYFENFFWGIENRVIDIFYCNSIIVRREKEKNFEKM